MKKYLLGSIAICFAASIFSCSSDDNGSSSNNPTVSEVTSTMSSGGWKITKYIDSGNDETTDFSGYNFTFNQNSILMANKGSEEIMGTWSVTNDDSSDDSPSNDLDFNVFFAGPAKFAELSDDWDIESQTATKLVLIDISGGNGGTDYLTFEKN